MTATVSLAEKCPDCGKIAKEKFNIKTVDRDGNDIQLITLECFHIIKKIIPKATKFESLVSNSWQPQVASCIHKWNKTKCEKCGEYRLYPFQLTGVKRAEYSLSISKGVGIFDDMGLGKTVQALALIKFHAEYTPTLYIVKSAITFNWFKQIIRWLGPNYLPQIIKTGRDYIFPGLKSYVISYDLLRHIEPSKLDALGIKCVVLDECQQIKNTQSTRTQQVKRLIKGDVKVIPLSGTPWKNRGSEFFSVLNMIDPIKFWSEKAYVDRWVDTYWDGGKPKQGGIRDIKQFKEYTENLIIRREFNEVMDEFPDINRMKLPVELDNLSQTSYDSAQSEFVEWYNNAVIGGEEDALNGIELLAKMAKMRHITGLAKIPATLGYVEEFFDTDPEKKLVIFVHHKDVMHIMHNCVTDVSDSNKDWSDLAQYLKDNRIKVMLLNAEMSDAERFQVQEDFNKAPRVLAIMSTLASGEGIDLQTCHDSILHERQWNPQNEDQATPGRFRRIGQTSSVVNITVPEAEGTIDEHLDYLVEGKRERYHDAMNKTELVRYNESDLGKQLAEMIVKKHNEKFKNRPSGTKSLTKQVQFGRRAS